MRISLKMATAEYGMTIIKKCFSFPALGVLIVRGRSCQKWANLEKKKFHLILQLHYTLLMPQIYQKILLSDPR